MKHPCCRGQDACGRRRTSRSSQRRGRTRPSSTRPSPQGRTARHVQMVNAHFALGKCLHVPRCRARRAQLRMACLFSPPHDPWPPFRVGGRPQTVVIRVSVNDAVTPLTEQWQRRRFASARHACDQDLRHTVRLRESGLRTVPNCGSPIGRSSAVNDPRLLFWARQLLTSFLAAIIPHR